MHLVFLIIICVLIIVSLIISGVQQKKERSAMVQASSDYLKASQIYSEGQSKFIEFLKERFSDSGVLKTTPTTPTAT